jgi:putative transposase
VPAAYSSQTCSACGTVDAESRRSQAVFHCTSCGYRDHADLNAAKILLARANRSGLPVEGSPKLGTPRNRKRIGLRVPRRPFSESSAL